MCVFIYIYINKYAFLVSYPCPSPTKTMAVSSKAYFHRICSVFGARLYAREELFTHAWNDPPIVGSPHHAVRLARASLSISKNTNVIPFERMI